MPLSRRFKALDNRVRTLQSHCLPAHFSPIGKYSTREHDLARAYVLLAHAEIESYLEDRAREIAQRASARWAKTGMHSKTLRRVVGFHNQRNKEPWKPFDKSPDRIRAALNSYDSLIRGNHGIKEINILGLLYPLGIEYSDLEVTWLMSLESFGHYRGSIAHSSIKTQQLIDPATEFKKVVDILKGLKRLDKKLSRLK